MKKKLLILLCVLIFIAVAGYGAYTIGINYIQDKAVSTMLEDQINGMLDSGELTLEDLEDALDDDFVVDGVEGEQTSDVREEAPGSGVTESETSKTNEGPQKEETSKKQEQAKKPESAKEDVNKKEPAQSREEVVEKASEKIENKIPRKDKQEMMRLIGSRLSGADVSYLAGLLKDGLSSAEISAAKKLAFSRFTKQELWKAHDFYHKYIGLIKKQK